MLLCFLLQAAPGLTHLAGLGSQSLQRTNARDVRVYRGRGGELAALCSFRAMAVKDFSLQWAKHLHSFERLEGM